jgi:hypothetical protein
MQNILHNILRDAPDLRHADVVAWADVKPVINIRYSSKATSKACQPRKADIRRKGEVSKVRATEHKY